MKPDSTMHQIGHHKVRPAANSDNAGAVGRPVSGLAIPDDPIESIIESLGADMGFTRDAAGHAKCAAWLEGYQDVLINLSTTAGEDFLEMRPPDTTVAFAAEAEEKVTRAETVAMTNHSPFSSSDAVNKQDGGHCLSSSDSSSEEEKEEDDAHWLPSKSKKRGGTKRRLQQQTRSSLAEQTGLVVVRPAPRRVVAAVEGGGAGSGKCCRDCGRTETPLWRAGPEGPKTLCNACGLRFKKKLAAAGTTNRRPAVKASNHASARS